MNKIFIIIKREYLTRVKKRSFIILTLLIPFLFIGFAALMGSIASSKSEKKNIAVVDDSHMFEGKLKNNENVSYTIIRGNVDSLKHNINNDDYNALLYIPAFDPNQKDINFNLYYNEQVGIITEKTIGDNLNSILTDERMSKAGISNEQLEFLQSESIHISSIKDGKESSNASSIAIGTGCGFLLYMFMLFYGMSVMRSVMEEKTNRIAEIIVSSVRPFQLMMGKIIGVALVGLTQVLIWIILFGVFALIGLPMLTGGMHTAMDPQAMQQASENTNMHALESLLHGPNWIAIALWFLFYFLGGYFLYAALFASVGSLVNEDPQESSQYTLPITLPIILGFVIMSKAISDPNSPLAIFGSLFPLTSPIVMMARIPFGDVPAWQLITSAVLLVLGFILTTWMAGKIYRTGILMYGKKITLKEVGKWLVRK
ncbi:ABC transporter permease [Taibaiella lutea]|uniref:ABC transporter permease n=1 Tax=Taibaiella lutea TaxID=2608001 RepID=A0A5M6CLZ7_9BACT|nr:ABC transporter permease [Taibaiella lutea]KAA5535002.1 ABC transporter permease [Taibaiella lutea]